MNIGVTEKNEAEAMTFFYGNLHLMLIFTLGNNWSECIEIQKIICKLTRLNIKDVDFRLLPFETMTIFEERMKRIKKKNWNSLIQAIGINATITHFCSRVKFQALGAPHHESFM